MFESWLNTHYPDRARHVLSLIRATRAGELNDPRFHDRFIGGGAYAELLAQRFDRVARAFNLTDRPELQTAHFAPPGDAVAAEAPQLSLF